MTAPPPISTHTQRALLDAKRLHARWHASATSADSERAREALFLSLCTLMTHLDADVEIAKKGL